MLLPCLLSQEAKARLRLTRDISTGLDGSYYRPALFQAAALRIAELFKQDPDLQDVKLTTMLQVESAYEGVERVIRWVHHIKIVSDGTGLFSDEAKVDFFYEWFPYWVMGDGAMGLERSNPLLGALLEAEDNSAAKQLAATALAQRLAEQFESVRVTHLSGSRFGGQPSGE